MVFTRKSIRAALTVAAALGVSLLASPAAHAAVTDDSRALAFDGNVKKCAEAGLQGERVAVLDGENDDTSNIDYIEGALDEDRFLTITAVDEGVTVTGIVIKGGDGYNVYEPGARDLPQDPPWKNLSAPKVGADDKNLPQLSHWFVCGTVQPPTTTTTTPTTPTTTTTSTTPTTTTPTTTTGTTTTTTSTTEPPSSAPTNSEPPSTTTTEPVPTTTTTTSAPGVVNTGNDDELAVTGFGGGWLAWAGVLLLLAGVAMISGMRALRRQG